jgi:hypothetical protein
MLEVTDKNVEAVITKVAHRAFLPALAAKFRNRVKHGYCKYGVTTERQDLTQSQWIEHLIEELMDAAVYAQVNLSLEQPPAVRRAFEACQARILESLENIWKLR